MGGVISYFLSTFVLSKQNKRDDYLKLQYKYRKTERCV